MVRYGDYECDTDLVKKLGSGGMGVVFKGFHYLTNEPVAIKFIEITTDEDLKRVKREIATLVTLDSIFLKIAPLKSYGQWIGSDGNVKGYYIVTEFVDGITLEEKIRLNQGGIPLSEAIDMMVTISSTIHECHKRNVIHRDIKPSNIIINKKEEPVVLDFGIAHNINLSRLTHTSVGMGTTGYMAPEQAQNASDVTGAADIYSLGIVLYEIIEGNLPVKSESNITTTIKKFIGRTPPPVFQYQRIKDENLIKIIEKACHKEPAKRYINAQEFANALKEWKNKYGIWIIPLKPGDSIGNYLITNIIEDKGETKVYKAKKIQDKHGVVLKFPYWRYWEGEEKQRFNIHMDKLIAIGEILGRGEYYSSPYIVMEIEPVKGQPLSDIIQMEGDLPESKRLCYAVGLCNALGRWHKQQLFHGNLKPENIILTDRGIRFINYSIYSNKDMACKNSNNKGMACKNNFYIFSYIQNFVSLIFSEMQLNFLNTSCKFYPQTNEKKDITALFLILQKLLKKECNSIKLLLSKDKKPLHQFSLSLINKRLEQMGKVKTLKEIETSWDVIQCLCFNGVENEIKENLRNCMIQKLGESLKDDQWRSWMENRAQEIIEERALICKMTEKRLDNLSSPKDTKALSGKFDCVFPGIMGYIGQNKHGFHEYEHIKTGAIMILIPAGEFIMGSDTYPDASIHHVHLDAFLISKYPVTNSQYKKFIEDKGYDIREYWSHIGWKEKKNHGWSQPEFWTQEPWNKDEHPVVGVSWYEAEAYCNWAGQSLPTEAQWEKSGRGGIWFDGDRFKENKNPEPTRKHPWGYEEPDKEEKRPANYETEPQYGGKGTSPVGAFPEGISAYGCYDMGGNVWEWCLDWYHEGYYKKSAPKNPTGPKKGEYRVLRGGSWFYESEGLSVSYRFKEHPGYWRWRRPDVGFRPSRTLY